MPAPDCLPDAVIFDLDGLLVDSEHAWARADRRVVEDCGGVWDDSVHRRLIGRGPEDAARLLADHLDRRHRPADIAGWVLAAAQAEFATGLCARPGAMALVQALHGRVPLAVATNSSASLAAAALLATGLGERLDTVVCVDDVAAPKPAPDVYELACAKVGARPTRSVALDDSPSGVAAAKAAGLWVIGCPSLPDVVLAAADAVVDSLSVIDADRLCQPARRAGSRGSLDSPT